MNIDSLLFKERHLMFLFVVSDDKEKYRVELLKIAEEIDKKILNMLRGKNERRL